MSDLDIIKQLEKELDLKLEQLDKIEWNSKGYMLNQDREVTELSLYDCQINNLKRIINRLQDLTYLTTLNLTFNQFIDIYPLRDLKKLIFLALRNNQLSDISPLKDLKNLTYLTLRSNQLIDISPMKDLKKLTYLTLRGNKLSDISPLKDLKNLTYLNLRGNQLINISSLKNLTNLTHLILRSNQLSDISPLKELKKLTTLNLSVNQVSDISPLKGLTNLTNLNMYSNQLIDISPLKDLTNLKELNLSENQLIDISPLKDLTNLKNLLLTKNQLIDISPLKDLTNLEKLLLTNNQLIDISPLKDLTNIKELNLSGNQLIDISPLKDLTNLEELLLTNNHFIDIAPLKDLTNLIELRISNNQLIDIFPLKDLTKLTRLFLSSNQLVDISPLKDLTNLIELHISNNQLIDIFPLKDLTKLTKLFLSSNQLVDISPLKNLAKLTELYLIRNPIENLPSWITDFNMEIRWTTYSKEGSITFYKNPLKSPPVEIVKQGKEDIKNYFEQLEIQGKDNIYEAKLMLVGEPGSGKTTLMNLLFDRDYPVPDNNQKSTPRIEVRQNWAFSVDDKKDFHAHIWDFGGQPIQYMLHQFFLTSDCVYVLMAEKRRELANFGYWLNIINILAQNSPVVTLFNEINIDSVSSFIYDERKYNDLFSELDLHKLDVDLADIDDGRFDVLLNTIKNKLGRLAHIGKEVPARWVDIRKELDNRREKKHININEYFEICRKFEIEKEADRMLILRYFHLLGIVLHFRDDTNLCDTLFLDPNWTVDAVYSVLADKEIEKSNGFVKKSDIDKIWSEKKYEYDERAKLLQLMLKDNFELCYKLQGTKDEYIVPLLLSPQKPPYDWNNNDNLQFRFQYPFMPKGIVSRLIVRMHEYIDQNIVWKEGVVFSKNGAAAQVIEQKTTKEGLKIIEILLNGTPNSRKDLLTLIREEIKKIQNSSFPNLPYI